MSTATIDEAGVYDLPAETYIADPVKGGSLSRTGARHLLPPSCPAKYRWWRDNGEAPKQVYDFGHVAHREVLGIGGQIEVFPRIDGRTTAGKANRAAIDDARAEGRTPIFEDDYATIREMAAALRAHRLGGQPLGDLLLNPERGEPERTLIWQDMATGVWWRSMLDWLPTYLTASGRLIIPDYKTTESAATETFTKSIANYGYDMQAAAYCDGARAVGLADEVAFVFIVQEKNPPYLVNVIQLDEPWFKAGRALNIRASQTYAQCSRAEAKGMPVAEAWPGYSPSGSRSSTPYWLESRYTAEGIMQ